MADLDRNIRDDEEQCVAEGKTVSRRDFLKMAGVAGAAVGLAGGLGGLVAACGDDEEPATTTAAAETTTTAAAETTTTAAGETTTTASAGAEMGREIKLGFITPLTGGIASFGVPDQYCADRAQEAIGDGIVCGDSKKHPVTIMVRDSQSDTNRAAQVTGDLITQDKCDIIVTASTPDTVCPVADQAEALQTPCLSNDCPWQAYVATRAAGDLSATFKWTYHTFWGLEDVQANFLDMWGQVTTNKKVGCMWSNDADGQAWKEGWAPVYEATGLAASIPGDFQLQTEDFTSQLAQFKNDGCEIGVGVFIPPDFTNFWKQASQQGWKPKVASFGKALLFPESVASVGEVGNGLTTEVWWMPTHPFKSPLTGETCQEFADEYSKRQNGAQWTQPLLHFIIFEWAVDVLKRTANVDDKEAIMTAVKATKMDTIGGHIDFSAPVEPAGPPWTPGPRHVHENVYKTPQVGGQWRTGTKYPYELTIVSTAAVPAELGIKATDKVQPLS
ncbi:MAG: ABC transporter substrate-binding protein [Thermoleophilia bacterium]|nr:ABC transporter substrate-binding protein [Thermoleophilia bacterium]